MNEMIVDLQTEVDLDPKVRESVKVKEEGKLGRSMIRHQELLRGLENLDDEKLVKLQREVLGVENKEKYSLVKGIDKFRQDVFGSIKRDEFGQVTAESQKQIVEVVEKSQLGKGKKIIELGKFGHAADLSEVKFEDDKLLDELAEIMQSGEGQDELQLIEDLENQMTDKQLSELTETLIALQISRMESMGLKDDAINNGIAHIKEVVANANNAPDKRKLSVLIESVHDFEKYGQGGTYLGEHETASAILGSVVLKKLFEQDQELSKYANTVGKLAAKSILLHGKAEFPENKATSTMLVPEKGIAELFNGIHLRQLRPGKMLNYDQLVNEHVYVPLSQGSLGVIGLLERWRHKLKENDKLFKHVSHEQTIKEGIKRNLIPDEMPEEMKQKCKQIRTMVEIVNGVRAADMEISQTWTSLKKFNMESHSRERVKDSLFGYSSQWEYMKGDFIEGTAWASQFIPKETGVYKNELDLTQNRFTFFNLCYDVAHKRPFEEFVKENAYVPNEQKGEMMQGINMDEVKARRLLRLTLNEVETLRPVYEKLQEMNVCYELGKGELEDSKIIKKQLLEVGVSEEIVGRLSEEKLTKEELRTVYDELFNEAADLMSVINFPIDEGTSGNLPLSARNFKKREILPHIKDLKSVTNIIPDSLKVDEPLYEDWLNL